MSINKVIAVGIILIIIFYIFLSYNKDEYSDLKEAIGIVGLIIGFMTFLMLFLGK